MDILGDSEILLGTYEAFVLGYKLAEDPVSGNLKLQTSFANHAHSSTVRSVAAADKFLVTSGSDENVKIFNLRNRTEHGNLTHSDGTLRSMKFYDKRHLVTGSEDNMICIVKATGSWNVEKTLAKHQGAVTDLAVHPSGKMMLSIGEDNKLITWNLIKGRSAYVTNIKERADFVRWSPSGTHYIVGFYKHVDIYSVANASVLFSIKTTGRSNDVAFFDDNTFALAGETSKVEVYSILGESASLVTHFEAHQNRVRCLAVVKPKEQVIANGRRFCLVTASNDGMVKVWSISIQSKEEVKTKLVTEIDTKCRVTCMIVHKVPPVAQHQEDDNSGLKRTATSETPEGVDEVLTSKKPKKKKVKVEEQEELSEIGKKQSPKNTSSVSTTESETPSKKKKIKKK